MGSERDAREIDLRWVKQIKHFYADLPLNFRNKYEQQTNHVPGNPYKDMYPRVWKTVGDEIILCCRVVSLEHLALSAAAFVTAVKDYGTYLDEVGGHLDVKAAAWTAAFPEPNVTVNVAGRNDAYEINPDDAGRPADENFECQADTNPNQFDFLGKHIDCGFRITRFASTDGLVLSMDLAYLLSKSCHEDADRFHFNYLGRHLLKGVIGDRPYPIFVIDTERSAQKRRVKIKEQSLIRTDRSEALSVCEFIDAFMVDEGIEFPVLPASASGQQDIQLLPSYEQFRERWENEENATAKSAELHKKSESAAEDTGGEIPEKSRQLLERRASQVRRHENKGEAGS